MERHAAPKSYDMPFRPHDEARYGARVAGWLAGWGREAHKKGRTVWEGPPGWFLVGSGVGLCRRGVLPQGLKDSFSPNERSPASPSPGTM